MSIVEQLSVQNPWTGIEMGERPYSFVEDRLFIESHNAKVKAEYKLPPDVYLEPFIGNPEAPILLLNLNPGHAASGAVFHAKRAIGEIEVANLRHEESEYPFFPVGQPYLKNGGSRWWSQSLRGWVEEYGSKKVAEAFFCVEYFPYASRRYKGMRDTLPSQHYSFALVAEKVRTDCVIIIMRAASLWIDAVPALVSYPWYKANNPQSKSLNGPDSRHKGNLPEKAVEKIHSVLSPLLP